MIYTCTLNPSLDYYMEFENDLSSIETNRSQLEYYEAGGKGINVSIVLNNLMIPTRALGFIGGFTKDFYINLLQKYEYIQPSFTYIEGHTRINVKAKVNGSDIDLNAAGPYITEKSIDQLINKVDRLDHNDIFVFSGNSPEYLLDKVDKMISICHENGVRIVLDTNPAIIRKSLKYKPFLINPSTFELAKIVDKECNTQEEIINAAKECVSMGAINVMVRLTNEGSILVNEDGVYKAEHSTEHDVIVNTVGTNDAMVAGFVMNSLRTGKAVDSFRYANCCGEATIFSKNLEIRGKINSLYEKMVVEKIGEFE